MSLTAELAAARLLHEGALLVLFGLAAFPLYARRLPLPEAFQLWLRRGQAPLALAALVGGGAWLALSAADMSGQASDALDAAAVWSVVSDTDFGKLWAARLVLTAALALLAFLPRARIALAVAAGAALASLAGTGHASIPDGVVGRLHQVGDAAHLLAAGLWIGALWALGRLAARAPRDAATLDALRRFSGVGQCAVAVLILTGIGNAAAILESPTQLLTTTYGRLLDLKLAAFASMLALAGLNRWVLVPRLGAEGYARRLHTHILGEQVLALVVVSVVAAIGVLDPAG